VLAKLKNEDADGADIRNAVGDVDPFREGSEDSHTRAWRGVADLGIGTSVSLSCAVPSLSLPTTHTPPHAGSRVDNHVAPFPILSPAITHYRASSDTLLSTSSGTLLSTSSNLSLSQERVLKDSEQMIPRTRKSLEDAVLALQDLVVSWQLTTPKSTSRRSTRPLGR
jgi:hypothetical protein